MDLGDCSDRSDQNNLNLYKFYNSDSSVSLGNVPSRNKGNNHNNYQNSHNIHYYNNILPQSIEEKNDEGNTKYGTVKRNIFMKIPSINGSYDKNAKNIFEKPENKISCSYDSFNPKNLKASYVTCSRATANVSTNYENEITFQEDNITEKVPLIRQNIRESKCSEKTTYCRPVLNLYNQEFVYKTMARNAKLQRLVKKLVVARQKERQNEEWNNYINELKNKHGYYNGKPRRISTQYSPDEFMRPELIDDFYNTRFSWKQSNPCQNLLEDFYGDLNFMQPNACYKPQFNYDREDRQLRLNYPQYIYENDPFCYPTSSQGRLLVLNRERERNHLADKWRYRPASRYIHGNTHMVDEDYTRKSKSKQSFKKTHDSKYPLAYTELNKNMTKSSAMQTDFKVIKYLPLSNVGDAMEYNHSAGMNDDMFKQQYDEVSKNVERLKKKIHKSQNDLKEVSLTNIENKLNELITSINTFVGEIKAKNTTLNSINNRKSISVSCRLSNNYANRLNMTKSDTFGLLKSEKPIWGIAQNNPNDSLALSDVGSRRKDYTNYSTSRLDTILYEEMNKSNKVKRDIEDIINKQTDRPCNVHITFDIPTKEISTEVTRSLSKAKVNSGKNQTAVEEIDNPITDLNERKMTIAVNTDPLGLLALLRISTETIKQILSFVPNIDYNSYLSMLQFPQVTNSGASHYVCNICGATFERPSQLSDHIQNHNLGKSRDCCVCRHVLDMRGYSPGVFACRYCGHRFTRAYCCELHQQTCARRLGIRHDVTPSLILLR